MKRWIKLILFLIVIIAAVFVIVKPFNKNPTGNIVRNAQTELKEFNVKAFRFGYDPDIITVNKWDKVRIVIENTDTIHGIRIPDLYINGYDSVEFVADKAGEFIWYCNKMCGPGHMQMGGKLIVKDA